MPIGELARILVPLSVHDLLMTLIRPLTRGIPTGGALQRRQVSAVKVPTDHPLHRVAIGHIDITRRPRHQQITQLPALPLVHI